MAALPMIGLVMGGIGSAVSAIGTIASGRAAEQIALQQQAQLKMQGEAAQTAANYEARNLEHQAKQEFASATREAGQLRRQKKLALSSLQARGAASGFDASDPSNLKIAEGIESYGSAQEGMALYGGSNRAQDLEASANARRYSGDTAYTSAIRSGETAAYEGKARKQASYWSAAGSLLGGVSTMASRFNSINNPTTPQYRY
jgi:hypothetical protein